MKKLLLISAIMLATGAAHATQIKPYVSNKFSYSNLSQTNAKTVYWDVAPQTQTQLFHDNSGGVFGNKLAVGAALPIDAIRGSIRTELEWGINTKAKTEHNESYKNIWYKDGGITYPDWDPAVADYEIKTGTYFFNAYYDFDTGSKWTPYVGIGAGLATIDLRSDYSELWGYPLGSIYCLDGVGNNCDTVIGKGDASNFAWNIELGVAYVINDSFSIDLGYRYARLGDVKTRVIGYVDGKPDSEWMNDGLWGQYEKATISLHDINLGVRYMF